MSKDSSGVGCLGMILIFLLGYAIGSEDDKILPDRVIIHPDGSKIEYYNEQQRTQADTGYYQTKSQTYQQPRDSLCTSTRVPRD